MRKADWIKSLQGVGCRDIGHRWLEGNGKQEVDRGFYGRELICERCGTVRIEVYHGQSGEMEMRRYIYPDSYKKPSEIDRVTKTEFRIENLRRQKVIPTSQRMDLIWNLQPGWRDL